MARADPRVASLGGGGRARSRDGQYRRALAIGPRVLLACRLDCGRVETADVALGTLHREARALEHLSRDLGAKPAIERLDGVAFGEGDDGRKRAGRVLGERVQQGRAEPLSTML